MSFRQMLREIKSLFFGERKYFYMLVVIAVFYAAALTAQKYTAEAPSSSIDVIDTRASQVVEEDFPKTTQELQERLENRPLLSFGLKTATVFLIMFFALGAWFGSQDLWRWCQGKEIVPSRDRTMSVPWGIGEVIKVIILFFACGIIFNILLAIAKFLFFSELGGYYLLLSQALVLDAAAVFMILWVVKKKGARAEDVTGFRFPKFSKTEIWYGIRSYLEILPIFATLLVGLILIVQFLKYEPPPHPLVEVLLAEETLTPMMITFSLFLACFVGPVVEEIFFRGFLYPALKNYWGKRWAMVVTAAMFGLVHENSFAFIPIFFLGLVLVYLFEKRKDLTACISLHILHNSVFILYFYLLKSLMSDSGLMG